MHTRHIPLGLSAAALALALGCAVGPDYRKPDAAAPEAYSEAGPWKPAEPRDQLPKTGWWHVFRDPTLDALEDQAASASPTLRAALARYDQALAAARIEGSQLYPSLDLGPSAVRERYSGNRQAEFPSTRFQYTTNSFDLPLQLSYEVDLFGSVRRSLESARASAEAEGAAYQGVLLVLQAGVAEDYFNLRSLVAQRDLLVQNVALLTDALELVRTLRRGGANSDLDLDQAVAELETVRGSELASERAIARALHALAVLVGRNPEGFAVDVRPLGTEVPVVPVGLPSELLERRPDIAQAERTLAAANARIGVAKAAFFPSIGLTAFAGVNSSDLNNLLSWSSREWAAGPALSLPLFKGGANEAGYRQAKAAYQEALADYRQQVLVGFQEVEDGLSDLRLLSKEAEALTSAVQAAQGATRLSTVRYKAGLVSYLEVIDSQRTQLADEISLTQAGADRLSATVFLIRALGGGW
jgi:multidrug efflux system outer membrane protein